MPSIQRRPQVATADASLRPPTLAEVTDHLDTAPWIANIGDVVGQLQAAGNLVLVCTVTWRFAAEHLRRLHGFDAVSGTVMGTRKGVLTGAVVRHFDREDKIGFVGEHCARCGLDLHNVVAVGDARSDLPLFAVAGRAVALNATPHARAAADAVIDTGDLSDLLPVLQRADAGAPRPPHRTCYGVPDREHIKGAWMADSTFTFRVDEELKAAFADIAAAQEHTAAQLLRVLMRNTVQQWHESQEHGAWIHSEVKHALQEAADPTIERIPHDRVLSSWRQQRAELERRAAGRSA